MPVCLDRGAGAGARAHQDAGQPDVLVVREDGRHQRDARADDERPQRRQRGLRAGRHISGALQDRRKTACPTKRRAAVGHCACKASCMQPQVPHAICGSRVGCARGLPDRSAVGRLTQSSQVHHFLRPFCYFTSRTATARCSSSLQRARQTGEGLQQLHRVRVERTCRGLASSSMSMPSSSRACVRMGSRLVKAIATCAAGGQLRHPPLTLWHGDSSVMAR